MYGYTIGDARGDTAPAARDSAGHLHEVLAGDLFHPEFESVPEQTWSSAGLLRAAVAAMLGLEPRPATNSLGFAPHLPAQWPTLTLRNVRVGSTRSTLRLTRSDDSLTLTVDNPGAPLAIDFAPELPLGAMPTKAAVGGRPAMATVEEHGQDRHARLRFTAATGTTTVRIEWKGGLTVAVAPPAPELGQRSRALILTRARLDGDALVLDGWITGPGDADLTVTGARAMTAEQSSVAALGEQRWKVTLAPTGPAGIGGFAPARATVRIAPP